MDCKVGLDEIAWVLGGSTLGVVCVCVNSSLVNLWGEWLIHVIPIIILVILHRAEILG